MSFFNLIALSINSYQRHKSMFVIFIILTVVSFSSVQFIAPISKTTQLEYHCNDGVHDLRFCPKSLDRCAADLFLQNSKKNTTKEYTFDVSNTYYANPIPLRARDLIRMNPLIVAMRGQRKLDVGSHLQGMGEQHKLWKR